MKRLLGALALGGLMALSTAVPGVSAQNYGTPYGYPTTGYGAAGYGAAGYGAAGYGMAGYGTPQAYTSMGVPYLGSTYGSPYGATGAAAWGPYPSSYGYLGGYGPPNTGYSLGGAYSYTGGYPYYGTGGYPYLGAYGGYPNTIGNYGGYPLYGGYGSPSLYGAPYGSYTAGYGSTYGSAGSYGGLSPVAPIGTYSGAGQGMVCTGLGYPC
jgi:hypothetical protein